MEMLNHFGYQIGVASLVTMDPEDTIDHLRNQPREQGTADHNMKNIYTRDERLLHQEFFEDVLEEVEFLSTMYAKKCGHKVEHVGVTQSTSSMLKNGGSMRNHMHSNSYISGVFYPTDGSSIRLYNPLYGKLFMLEPEIDYDADNPCTWEYVTIKPEPGKILFFPSEIPHSVEPNDDRAGRFSIAFNMMPAGVFGGFTRRISMDVDRDTIIRR